MIEVDNKDHKDHKAQEPIVDQVDKLLETYIVVKCESDNVPEFTHEVKLNIENGYSTIGGVSVSVVDGVEFLLQAMLKR